MLSLGLRVLYICVLPCFSIYCPVLSLSLIKHTPSTRTCILPLLTARITFLLIKLMPPLGENQHRRLNTVFILLSTDQTKENILKRCVFVLRSSLERLYQASLPLSEVNSVPAELLSSHQALLQEAWTRLRHLQEYQAFGEALRAVEDWLEEVKGRLEKLESTEGNKEEVEGRLERVQV